MAGRSCSACRATGGDIPGEGTNRINAALPFGGPELLTETVVDATVFLSTIISRSTLLDSPRSSMPSVGIELDIPYPARDLKSGLEIDAGKQTVDGATALLTPGRDSTRNCAMESGSLRVAVIRGGRRASAR